MWGLTCVTSEPAGDFLIPYPINDGGREVCAAGAITYNRTDMVISSLSARERGGTTESRSGGVWKVSGN